MNSEFAYSEIDPFTVAWLRNLISQNHLPKGQILGNIYDIQKVPSTFHAFAGIGGWPFALILAGWPEDIPVWTGSCPCQPFSIAGKGKGTNDDRHLWPEWYRLIQKCRPPIIFGEQVASPAGRTWLDAVSLDLEALGYAVASADLCAASVGAPHKRQRLFFMAYSDSERCDRIGVQLQSRRSQQTNTQVVGSSKAMQLAYSNSTGSQRWSQQRNSSGERAARPDSVVGFWDDAGWLSCEDGKARPAEPGSFPLADGIPARVGRLRAYGNAIVPQVASEFIQASMELLK